MKFVERGELAKFKDAALKATRKENTATLKLGNRGHMIGFMHLFGQRSIY